MRSRLSLNYYRATRMHSADYAVPQSFFNHRVAPLFYFSYTKRDVNIPTGTP